MKGQAPLSNVSIECETSVRVVREAYRRIQNLGLELKTSVRAVRNTLRAKKRLQREPLLNSPAAPRRSYGASLTRR